LALFQLSHGQRKEVCGRSSVLNRASNAEPAFGHSLLGQAQNSRFAEAANFSRHHRMTLEFTPKLSHDLISSNHIVQRDFPPERDPDWSWWWQPSPFH
jgi:hypothetical protein